MKLLGNRRIAALIAATVIVLSLAFGVYRSVTAEAKKVNTMFERGTDGSGYGIAPDLRDRQEDAAYLTRFAERYSGLEAETELVTAVLGEFSEASTVSALYAADQKLESAVAALNLALQNAGLSENDDRFRAEAKADFDSRHLTVIREAANYNEAVDAFEETVLGGLPVRLFGWILRLPTVEAFR